MDGYLNDWDLKHWPALKFFSASWFKFGWRYHQFTKFNPYEDREWRGKNDSSVTVYMSWDKEKLYWAMVINDDVHKTGGEHVGIWPYDAIHLCIYPLPYKKGDIIKGMAYKDHCGINKFGKATIDRCQAFMGSAPSGKGWWPEGTEFAARKTRTGYIYECAYSRQALAPLRFEEGSRFRMAISYLDRDSDKEPKAFINWFWGTSNISGDIKNFGELCLIKGKQNKK